MAPQPSHRITRRTPVFLAIWLLLIAATTITAAEHLLIPSIILGWFGGIDCAIIAVYIAWTTSPRFRARIHRTGRHA